MFFYFVKVHMRNKAQKSNSQNSLPQTSKEQCLITIYDEKIQVMNRFLTMMKLVSSEKWFESRHHQIVKKRWSAR